MRERSSGAPLGVSEMGRNYLGFPTPAAACQPGGFFFFIFKKNQNFKNICPFSKILKIYPGRPTGGDRAKM